MTEPIAPDPVAPAGSPPPESTPTDEPSAAREPATGTSPDPAIMARLDPDRQTARFQNRVAAIGLAALLVAIAFGAGYTAGRASAPASAAASPVPPASSAPSPIGSQKLPSDGPRLGRADAKVVVDYWADYQCPFCSQFAREIIPQLTSRIADGTVALVHRDFAFLGQESVDAAVATRCADREDRFWAMHDAVYGAQQGENQGALSRDRLLAVGASIGLEPAAFAACLDERAPLVEVLADTAAGNRVGITSTPTVDVNGRRFTGVSDVVVLLAAIDAAAAGQAAVPLPTMAPLPDPWAGLPTAGSTAGDPDAPVTVEIWMDFQGAAGPTVANDLAPELRARVGSGAVRLVRRDLAILGEESVAAASTVRCADRQGGPAWFVGDILASAGQGAGTGLFTAANLLRLGSRLGLDVEALDACLRDPATASAVAAETAVGRAAGLSAGPAILVLAEGREVARFTGPIDVATVLAALDAAAG